VDKYGTKGRSHGDLSARRPTALVEKEDASDNAETPRVIARPKSASFVWEGAGGTTGVII